MAQNFTCVTLNPESPAADGFSVTPDDSNDLARVARLYVGGTGNLVVTLRDMTDGTSITLSSVAVGYQPLLVKRVWSTGTTATNIVALT